jgi:transcriptional regulator with XRE-family HTH domain
MANIDKRAFHKRLCDCLGYLIATRRKRLGISQQELADRSDVDRAFISKVESGKRNPSFALVSNLAYGLDMSYGRLVQNCERLASQGFSRNN